MNIFFGSVILVLILYVFFVFSRGKKRKVVEKKEVLLSDIAQLWTKSKQSGQVHIKDIAPLWRKNSTILKKEANFTFQTEKIENFFIENIENQPWFDHNGFHKILCYQILLRLEEEGDCPSVVNPTSDVESSWDNNTYNILGRTSLIDHTLHVAENITELLINAEAHHVIPDAMVAALAHDLGKLPSNRTHLYSLGEHPLAAGRVLAELSLFKDLLRKEEILRAVKHHHMKPEGLIGKTLKKADQKARQFELERGVELQAEHDKPSNKNGSARKAESDIYSAGEVNLLETENNVIHPINISSWFDAQSFLDELKPYINRIEGRRFMAFSMPSGYVFFQAKALENVARNLAEKNGAMDIATMADKDKSMQKILFSVVDIFRKQYDLIAKDLIKDKYFGGYFNVKMKGGKYLKGFYVPFKAQAFGSISEFEGEKKGILKNFVSVEVYQK